MNLQRKKLSLAVMAILLGSVSLTTVRAETQTDDEIINSTYNSADIEFNNTGSGAGATDWEICTGQNSCGTSGTDVPQAGFKIADTTAKTYAIGIEQGGVGTSTAPLLYLDSGEKVGINTSTPEEELTINSTRPGIRFNDTTSGAWDFNLVADGNLFVLEDALGNNIMTVEGNNSNTPLYLDSDGDVGIQVANPVADLQVGGDGAILLENGTTDWALEPSFSSLWFRTGNNTTHGTGVMKLDADAREDSIVATSTGVGIGTSSPATTLHVKKAGAVLKVEDTNSTSAVRTVVQLKNKGAVGFSMEDTSQPVTWDFRTSGTGNFIMNDVGDGAEVTVLRNGNMIVAGTVIEGSSRAIKTDIDPINSKEFMDKLSKVEVLEWRYKEADKNDRHIGPISEDFYKLFKLGADDKHVSPRDIASIALLAAKELQMQSVSLAAENAALKKQLEDKTSALQSSNKNLDAKTAALTISNVKLQERLASLEKLVTNLASANGSIGLKARKVVMNMK